MITRGDFEKKELQNKSKEIQKKQMLIFCLFAS